MNRRDFLRNASATISLLALGGLTNCAVHPQKPNILLIVTDDQGYADMGCIGLAKDVKTPNMDNLAKTGTRFTNAYATSPICSPSRMGIQTGTYNERFGTFWYGGKGIHREEFKTIAELLKIQNYTTGYIGKVHHGSNDHHINNRNFPNNHGFDYYYGFTSARKHYLNHNAKLEDNFQKLKKEYKRKGQSLRQQPMWENKKQIDVKGFSTELFTDKACDFIKKNQNKPFFLQLAFNAVHNFTYQLPKEYMEKHNLKGYHDWDPATEDYYDWYKKGRLPNNPEGRAQYLGQLAYLDESIGKVINYLKDNKLYDNTLILMISDNGGSTPIYANNSPLRGSKYTLYEGGIRVPMIISWPQKYQQKIVSDNIVSGLDILPTICKATGTEIPNNIDGLDLTDLLTGKNKDLSHEILYWDAGHQTAIRKGKWKLRTANDKWSQDYEMVELELGEYLYNLEEDISEQNNLAEKYPDKVAELKNLFNEWKQNL